MPAIIAGAGALIVWAAHFLAIYGAQAIACQRAQAGAMLLGFPLVPAMVLGLTALALLIVAWLGFVAWRRLAGGMAGEDGEDMPQFTAWIAAATALLAALAIIWEALPVFLLPPCA